MGKIKIISFLAVVRNIFINKLFLLNFKNISKLKINLPRGNRRRKVFPTIGSLPGPGILRNNLPVRLK